MTKAELVSAVAAEADITKVKAEKAVAAFIGAVTCALKKGDKLSLVGFGTFSTSKRAARKGQNPQTGKKINIPAATVPKFKPGKTLKEAVNSKK
jgi:DNA-binding protein HU-beta